MTRLSRGRKIDVHKAVYNANNTSVGINFDTKVNGVERAKMEMLKSSNCRDTYHNTIVATPYPYAVMKVSEELNQSGLENSGVFCMPSVKHTHPILKFFLRPAARSLFRRNHR